MENLYFDESAQRGHGQQVVETSIKVGRPRNGCSSHMFRPDTIKWYGDITVITLILDFSTLNDVTITPITFKRVSPTLVGHNVNRKGKAEVKLNGLVTLLRKETISKTVPTTQLSFVFVPQTEEMGVNYSSFYFRFYNCCLCCNRTESYHEVVPHHGQSV